jgi:hypothetical protein
MGWDDYHLHQFTIGRVEYGTADNEWGLEEIEDERKVRLDQVATVKSKFLYVYDFGDDWNHQIVVEKVLPPQSGVRYPSCVAGERNCPPEDCGGMWGFYDMLEKIADPKHPEHEETVEWLGDPFDPETLRARRTMLILTITRQKLEQVGTVELDGR